MKKLLLAAPIAAVALAIARYFVIITSLDPETGFSNKPLPVILFSAVLILVAAAPIALRFVMKKLTDDRLNGYYTCKMPVYAISAAIAGGAYLLLGAKSLIDGEAVNATNWYWQLACAVLLLIGGVTMLLYIPTIFKKDLPFAKAIALGPLLASLMLLLTTFINYAVLANTMDRLLDYAMLILVLLYFTSEAKLRVENGDYRSVYSWGLSAIIVILVNCLPRLLLQITNVDYHFGFNMLSAVYLLLVPYLITSLYVLSKRAAKRPKFFDD